MPKKTTVKATRKRNKAEPYFYLAPAAVFIIIVFVYPIIEIFHASRENS